MESPWYIKDGVWSENSNAIMRPRADSPSTTHPVALGIAPSQASGSLVELAKEKSDNLPRLGDFALRDNESRRAVMPAFCDQRVDLKDGICFVIHASWLRTIFSAESVTTPGRPRGDDQTIFSTNGIVVRSNRISASERLSITRKMRAGHLVQYQVVYLAGRPLSGSASSSPMRV